VSWTREDAEREEFYERMYNQFGPEWAEAHDEELYRQHYGEAIKEFTAERLQSYYIAHPTLAEPARSVLRDAQALIQVNTRAALVFAVIAIELAIKTVLLKPVVFGLVHAEGLAHFITDLTLQQTGTGRFEDLLTRILASYGGVNLETFTRTGSTKPLWREIQELQKARNGIVHRGEAIPEETATLAVAVASTLLETIFPQVLAKLDLHVHDPGTICNTLHGVDVHVYFHPLPATTPSVSGSVELDLDKLDLSDMPDTITGRLRGDFSNEALAALRSVTGVLTMWFTSTVICYDIQLSPDSSHFSGTKAEIRFSELTSTKG
jgi:hypothetical protein